MLSDYLDAILGTMTEERRKHARHRIDCPVAALTPGRGKKRLIGRGWLHDINEQGARFFLNHTLETGVRISLDVDFRNPGGQVTTIRFPGIVQRVSEDGPYEIAVSFLKGESYIRGKRSQENGEESPLAHFTKGSIWIN